MNSTYSISRELHHDEQPHTFAKLLIAYLVNVGENRPISYDESTFKLAVPGDDRSFWIGNLFFEYRRTPMENWGQFFETAHSIWQSVQGPDWPLLPQMPHLVRPLRDETHPLSYKVIMDARGSHWQVRPPFSIRGGAELWNLSEAYTAWFSEQHSRGFKPAYCRAYKWLSTDTISIDELQVWAEFQIVLEQHPIPTANRTKLVNEMLCLLDFAKPPIRVRQTLQEFIAAAGSVNQAIRILRVADNIANLLGEP